MSTKSLLISFNDCPSSMDSLIPDNGLANLAGSLISKGHQTRIYDYSTFETVRDYRPAQIKRKLKKAFLRYKIETMIFKKMSKAVYKEFRDIEEGIELCRQKKIENVISELEAEIKEEGIDFLGFKLWSGEGFMGSAKIAKKIKADFPKIKIFAGGPHVEVFGEHVFNYTDAFDVLCQGEGEETILQLGEYVEGKRELKDISNIIYKEDGKIILTPIELIKELDSLAEPVYDESIYPAMKDDQKIKIIMLEESRGCPYDCNFCIHKIKSGNRWRVRNVGNIIESIKKISNKVGTKAFRFSGSNTPYFLRKQLAGGLIATGTKIKYICFADTRQPEKEDYLLLKKSGCVSLFFGVESADPYLLEEIMNKKTDPEWIRESLIKAKEAGILTVASIIVPCPKETKESIKATIDILVETMPDGVSVCPGACYPKTQWFLESKKFGFELPEDVERKMMTYTIKFTMPPALMEPFPFKIDGKDFYTMIDEIIQVSEALEKKGITTNLNDSLLLIAHVLGISPKQVKHLNQHSMILGECEKLRNKIAAFNARVKVK
ncbi:MAG: radical SAM protein [Candidatus Omnitrophota bacterium]